MRAPKNCRKSIVRANNSRICWKAHGSSGENGGDEGQVVAGQLIALAVLNDVDEDRGAGDTVDVTRVVACAGSVILIGAS